MSLGLKDKRGLTDKQKKAIDAYFLNGFNATAALKTAGYKHANVYAPRFFRRKDVAREVDRRREALNKKHDVTHERVLKELALIGFARMGDLIEVDESGNGWIDLAKLTDDQKAAMAEFTVDEYAEGRGDGKRRVIKTKLKLHDKKGALDSLARILGMFNDKLKIEGGEDLASRLQRGRERISKGKAP